MPDIKDSEKKALDELNREEGWIERNPGKVVAIIFGLLATLIVMLVKSCS